MGMAAAPGAGGHAVQDPWADYAASSGGRTQPADPAPVGEPARNLPQLATGAELEDHKSPSRIHHWHNYLLQGESWQIAWQRSSPRWGGVGPQVDVDSQWSAHDAMW